MVVVVAFGLHSRERMCSVLLVDSFHLIAFKVRQDVQSSGN